MTDYSIKEYVIENNQTIAPLLDYDRVKKVIIMSDFDISDDYSNHFGGMKCLEQFEVKDKDSRFYTEDGVLFANLSNDPTDEIHSKEMFFDFPKDFSGKILVAFPTNYPHKEYIIPEGTVAICRCAFEFTNIEELTLPSTLEFVDINGLSYTDNLKVLRVPNKELAIEEHYDVGKKFDFSIVSSGDSPLSEEVEKMWHMALGWHMAYQSESRIVLENIGSLYLYERVRRTWQYLEIYPTTEHPKDESQLGLELQRYGMYPRYLIWPNNEGFNEVMMSLSNKESILSYYQKHKNLENGSDENRLFLASFLYILDPCKLHPADECEANIVLEMMFGEQGLDDGWLKDLADSSSDYNQLSRLLSNDRKRLLDFINVITIHNILSARAQNLLTPLADNNNVSALSNLLYFQDAEYSHLAPEMMIKAAKLGDPVSMWMTAQEAFNAGGDWKEIALELWSKLSKGETTLPYIHIDDIIWDAKNNLEWYKRHSKGGE